MNDDLGFKGKVAVVTGGSSGIGQEIIKGLLEKGTKVVNGDLDSKGLEDLLEKYPDSLINETIDVTDEDDVKRMIDTAVNKFGQLDYGFNVAGMSKAGLVTEQELEDWKATIDVDLNGVFLATKHEARAMKKNENGGAIVNISSLNAHVPMFYGAAYSSAKAGVEMFSKNAALELAQYGIRVNTILPGLVDTPLTASYFENEDLTNEFMDAIPEKRAADPREIAEPAIFLVSDGASYINGTSLVVDGGWEITGYPNLSKYM